MKISNLENLKAIQQVEMDIENLNYSVAINKDYQNYQKTISFLKKFNDDIKDNKENLKQKEIDTTKAISVLNDFYKITNELLENANESISQITENDISIDELEELIEDFKKLDNDLKTNAEKLVNSKRQIFQLESEQDKIEKNIKDLIKNFKVNKLEQKYKELYKTYMAEKAKLEQKLNGFVKDADKNDLILYKKVKDQVKKLPIIVRKNNDLCTGCNLEIAPKIQSQLNNSGDCAICDECHRIIYNGD